MSLRTKNILYTSILLILIACVWWYRNREKPEFFQLAGNTMGTTYHVSYFDNHKRNFKDAIDSILVMVNQSINNYDSSSEVSRFNRSQRGIQVTTPHLLPSLNVAQKVFMASSGAFDMTVMPLVNAWGFGSGKKLEPTQILIDSLSSFVGFEKIQITNDSVTKSDPRVQLDFGGIGQGYGADVIYNFLLHEGITDMLVELGGEGLVRGKNLRTNKPWEIGILDPNSTHQNQFYKAYASLANRAFTTSGSYFNYREINGRKYSHTIDPQTGYPVNRPLLSASVFANDCATADAWATAFMVMGHEQTIKLVQRLPDLDVLLFYSDSTGIVQSFVSDRAKSFIKINQ